MSSVLQPLGGRVCEFGASLVYTRSSRTASLDKTLNNNKSKARQSKQANKQTNKTPNINTVKIVRVAHAIQNIQAGWLIGLLLGLERTMKPLNFVVLLLTLRCYLTVLLPDGENQSDELQEILFSQRARAWRSCNASCPVDPLWRKRTSLGRGSAGRQVHVPLGSHQDQIVLQRYAHAVHVA